MFFFDELDGLEIHAWGSASRAALLTPLDDALSLATFGFGCCL